MSLDPSEEDLNIVVEGDRLSVSAQSKQKTEEQKSVYLHRGIASRSFERTFRLADHIKVQQAELKNGLLSISLVREIPEEEKPRMIAINGDTPKMSGGTKKSHLLSKSK